MLKIYSCRNATLIAMADANVCAALSQSQRHALVTNCDADCCSATVIGVLFNVISSIVRTRALHKLMISVRGFNFLPAFLVVLHVCLLK